jgi:chromosome segregation ATPase
MYKTTKRKQISTMENHSVSPDSGGLAEIRELDSKRGKLQADHERAQGKLAEMEEIRQHIPASPEQVDKILEEAIENRKVTFRAYEVAKRELRGCHEHLKELAMKAHGFQQELSMMNGDGDVSERAKKEAEDNLSGVHESVAAFRPSLEAAEKKKHEMEAEA